MAAYGDNHTHLQVELTAKECQIPEDERARMQRSLGPIHEAVRGFPASHLAIQVIYHPRKQAYHVEGKLRVPGRTLFSRAEDAYLDSAFQRCAADLAGQVTAYADNPDRQAVQAADRRTGLDQQIVMPEDPDAGPLAEAVAAGDYRAFRNGLALYEDWLRRRVGRWIERIPAAEAQEVRGRPVIGDAVEEVYLLAFERFTQRPTDLRLSDWLDKLVDPAVKELLRHPDRTGEEANMARIVRQGL